MSEIVTKKIREENGIEIHEPTGSIGESIDTMSDWITKKINLGFKVRDVSQHYQLINVNSWVAYETKKNDESIVTFFKSP